MLFLINYDRAKGQLLSIQEFPDNERATASAARLNLEIELLTRANGHEVVLLESVSLESLKSTHKRYFDSLEKMKSIPKYKRVDT